ncbi:jg10218 [Pararge aegeria aegeria]|uniref:Jg10218 protein n=1 Tax=Pararge aegeria aegeria TaxID=348720 RepID=A0A8S4SGA2_9NEOP|nr:jg10218 [Pararge aegeria aegeria]
MNEAQTNTSSYQKQPSKPVLYNVQASGKKCQSQRELTHPSSQPESRASIRLPHHLISPNSLDPTKYGYLISFSVKAANLV